MENTTLDQPRVSITFPNSNRTQVHPTTIWPYNCIGQLKLTFPSTGGIGSGTLLSSRHVLTAAHNLYNSSYGQVTKVEFCPAKNGDTNPYGVFNAKRWFVSEEYKTLAPPYPNSDGTVVDYTRYLYDYAIIELDHDVPLPKFVKSSEVTGSQINNLNAVICGYPGDKPTGSMWQAAGKLQGPESEGNPFLFYQLSTYGGQSGCPILMKLNGDICSVGVHVAGSNFLQTNFGVRITDEVSDQIAQWMES